MIKKAFKTIFILTLCLGITLPANAGSVSVSDGSAFITKSELAYQLNNLSNRMNQLENSLDSRIDTLVSSYLTRNGIWNGAKQTITNTQCSTYYSYTASYGWLRSWNIGPSGVVAQTSLTNSNQYRRPDTRYVTNRTQFTNSLNKTGLLYLRFDSLPWQNQRISVIPQITENYGVYMQSLNGYYTDYMIISDQDNTLKYREDSKLSFVIGGSYYLPIYRNKIVFFFVSKNDKLYFEASCNTVFSYICTDDGTSQFGHKWNIKEISIY